MPLKCELAHVINVWLSPSEVLQSLRTENREMFIPAPVQPVVSVLKDGVPGK